MRKKIKLEEIKITNYTEKYSKICSCGHSKLEHYDFISDEVNPIHHEMCRVCDCLKFVDKLKWFELVASFLRNRRIDVELKKLFPKFGKE